LEFTHDLVIEEFGVVQTEITPDSMWIWAVGPENNNWGGKHNLQGAFTIQLSETCQIEVVPAEDEQEENLEEEGTARPDDQGGDEEVVEEEVTVPADDQEEEETAEEETNLVNGQEIDLGDNEEIEYDMSNTTDNGSPSIDAVNSVVFLETGSDETYGLWVIHGLFMGVAWGLCAPLAIGASLFRNVRWLNNDDALWFKIHVRLNLAVVFLTFLGFFVAVGAVKKEGNGAGLQNPHHRVGLTIFLFMFVQCLAGFFRPNGQGSEEPSIPEPSEPIRKETPPNKSVSSSDGEGVEVNVADLTAITDYEDNASEKRNEDDEDTWSLYTPPPPPESPPPELEEELGEIEAVTPTEEEEGLEVEPPKTLTKEKETPSSSSKLDPTLIRMYWKYAHRIFGLILLGLAWYNCHSGIVLFSEKYEANERHLLNVYWGLTGTIGVSFLMKGFVLRD